MDDNVDVDEGYPWGVYLCKCGILFIWYPDSKKDPKLNMFPESIKCECGLEAELIEKNRIKDYNTELVPLFLKVASKYKFKKLLMIDEEHVHFVWQTGREAPDYM